MNLEKRIESLENQIGRDKPIIFLVRQYVGTDNAANMEVLTPEEEDILQQHKEDIVSSSESGERFVTVHWNKDKARELLEIGNG